MILIYKKITYTFFIALLCVQIFFGQSSFDYKNYTIDEGLPSSSIVSIVQNDKGFIVVNTKNGSVVFNGYDFEGVKSSEIKNVKALNVILNFDISSFFKNKKVTSSIKDLQGSIWVGTESNGLYYIPNYKGVSLIKTDDKVYHFLKEGDSIKYIYQKRENGAHTIENKKIKEILSTQQINAIKKNDDLFFVATNNGVFQFDILNPTNYKVITMHNGLVSNEIFDIELLNNKLYVATQRGVSIVKLNTTNEVNNAIVVFPYVRLDSEKYSFPKNEIIVEPEYRYLTLKYLSLDYKAKGNLLYKYKIDGIHDDWIETRDTKIQFTSLPPKGSYVFEVKVKRQDNTWSDASEINLVFIQKFYQSNWFLALCALLLLAVLGSIIRWFYLKNIKDQKLKSELLKLENSALQSQMNPHFVFNALNSIQSFITTGDTLKSEIYLAKFSNLLRKTLNSSRLNEIELSAEIENLTMYLELEKLRFGDKLSYEIHIDESIETDFIKIPPMLIQPFVENSIIHGLSPMLEGGSVIINLKLKSESELYCTITDNGVGRKTKLNEKHKSLGTNIVKKRLSIISNPLKDYIKYIDLLDDNNQAIGTSVEFIIPI